VIESFPLYNGSLQLEFDSRRHSYRIVHPNGRKFKVPSVTTVLGVISKPALVPWAVNCAVDLCRASIVPGVEHSETFLDEVFKQAKGRARGIKEQAGATGHEVHNWIERYTRGEEPVLPSEGSQVRGGVDAFLLWLSQHTVEFIERERAVYSRRNRFSGRLDAVASVDGALALLDYKTSNGVYSEYILQAAGAYPLAYTEETGTRLEKAIILHLRKDDGQFTAHEFDARTLKRAGGAFLSALNLWRQLERLKKQL